MKHSNHLIHETSPYLLQHAHNPVNWYPWGDEALGLAKQKDKPILISIGYAACHWCHVMERESFENEMTAALMNAHFINIKIDREERPDLDHIYMEAVQAMSGSGGWPLNVFLTPEGKPFYGGTYFPPVKAFNRASWPEILEQVSTAFRERRTEIDTQAETLTEHITKSNSFGISNAYDGDSLFTMKKLDETFENVMKSADKEWGGFGKAPKFPQSFTIQFLLRYSHVKNSEGFEQEDGNAELALKQALLSLDRMIEGGIYDQVGGGFARYSTDTEWLAPHFEKMLYDNALLVSVLSEAYQMTHKRRYKEVIEETIEFMIRECMHPLGGFYAALDADSEEEEGKFYTWSMEEVQEALGADAEIFCSYYNISVKGNWEGKNILRVNKSIEEFAIVHGTDADWLRQSLKAGREKLRFLRETRIRPALDDKIILGWNALMNTALSKAFAATGQGEYRDLAISNMNFLLERFRIGKSEEFHHTWKNDQAKYPAFLDDYAYLIQALIHLQELTGETVWLVKAKAITEFVIADFSEELTGFFFFTRQGQKDVIVRKKEVYDGAVPSGNSIMAGNLLYLSIVFDKEEWGVRALAMINSLGRVMTGYPTSFGVWDSLLLQQVSGNHEIAILGKNPQQTHEEILGYYIPHKVMMIAFNDTEGFPLLAGKKATENVQIYLCRNYACLQPVSTTNALMSLINSVRKGN